MERGGKAVLISLNLLAMLATPESMAEAPRDIGIKEETGIVRSQIEVSVWPKNGDSALCQELAPSVLTLRVNGSERKAVVDFLGATNETDSTPLAITPPSPTGIKLVFVLDEDHLGEGFTSTNPGGPRPKAYAQFREVINELGPNDEALLISFKDSPFFATEFTTDKVYLLEKLNELELDPANLIRRPFITLKYFWNGWVDLIETLGLYEGHKDLILATTDVRGTEHYSQLARIAAAAAESRVRITTVYLGDAGIPEGLIAFAEAGGGKMFSHGKTVRHTIDTLRSFAKCNALMTFELSNKETRKEITTRVAISDNRFTVEAPTHRKVVERTPEEERSRIFNLLHWGEGFTVDASLYPLQPDPMGYWNSLLLARVIRTDDTIVAEDIPSIEIDYTVWAEAGDRTKIFGSQTIRLSDSARQSFLARKENIVPLFVPGVWPGQTHLIISLRTTRNGKLAGGSVKRVLQTPSQPRPGETAGWFLANQKPGSILTEFKGMLPSVSGIPLLPSLSGLVPQSKKAFGVAYGCRKKGEELSGELRSGDRESIRLPVTFTGDDRCGWFVASFPTSEVGEWRFQPPATNINDRGKLDAPISFRITEAVAQPSGGASAAATNFQ